VLLVAGATGYIGRSVVKELVDRGIETISVVRSQKSIPDLTLHYLKGSNIIECDVSQRKDIYDTMQKHKPDAVVCCLASRSGVGRDAWAIDYLASVNILHALESICSRSEQDANSNSNEDAIINSKNPHYVLLSAFCCGKPYLQFQYAKIQLERELSVSKKCSHSIVRPTAFFKSLDGQIESVRDGKPILYFGDGKCAANPICEKDLARFLADCALKPGMTKLSKTSVI